MLSIRSVVYNDLPPSQKQEFHDLVWRILEGPPFFSQDRPPWKDNCPYLLLAFQEDVLVGYLSSMSLLDYANLNDWSQERLKELTEDSDVSTWVYLAKFGVDEPFRSKGVGRALLERFHKDHKSQNILLHTLCYVHGTKEVNSSIDYYTRKGYSVSMDKSGSPRTFSKKGRDRIIMTKRC